MLNRMGTVWAVAGLWWWCAAGPAAGQGVTGATVTGGSAVLNADFAVEPARLTLQTVSEPATVIEFDKASGSTDLMLTLIQINEGMTWEGLVFSLGGGTFVSPPTGSFGGGVGTLRDANTTATLANRVEPGGFSVVDLNLRLTADLPTLRISPVLVPEPATVAVITLGLPWITGRRRQRTQGRRAGR